MSSLIKAKQLVLLLQDGFRLLGELTPTPSLINALKTELGQLKDMANDLNCLGQFSNVFSALENLLAVASQVDLERVSAPIYSPENIQIISETLRIISNHLVEVEKPDDINIQDLANVLECLHQQKSAEIKIITETQKIATIPQETARTEILETSPKTTIDPAAFRKEPIPATNTINFEKLPDTFNSGEAVKSPPPPFNNEGNEKEVQSVKPYLIVRVWDKFFAIFAKDIEKVVKLSLADLKLIGEEIFVSLYGNEIVLYDIASLLGSPPKVEDDGGKETFLAVILEAKNRKVGLLCDEIFGIEDLTVTKFPSVLGKIKGIFGLATFCPKITFATQSDSKEPVFVLEPSFLVPAHSQFPNSESRIPNSTPT
uniref:CheW-like domain-containing protein n=1 Tax=candidate division WOR-3 bacterium TaxID=2052148 RepID=A0A7C6A9R5_UNCW3